MLIGDVSKLYRWFTVDSCAEEISKIWLRFIFCFVLEGQGCPQILLILEGQGCPHIW
jgi:hypothetical protein